MTETVPNVFFALISNCKSRAPSDVNFKGRVPVNDGTSGTTCKVIPFFIEPNLTKFGIRSYASDSVGNVILTSASSDKSLPEKLPSVILVSV